jgi:hypothetical protein
MDFFKEGQSIILGKVLCDADIQARFISPGHLIKFVVLIVNHDVAHDLSSRGGVTELQVDIKSYFCNSLTFPKHQLICHEK